jgi:transcription termination factor NusB
MKHYLVALLALTVLFSCNTKKEESCKKPSSEKKFDMYQMSEMALLMEQMYVDNEQLKQRIIKGDSIGEFPNDFLKIHKAVMTDKQENDDFFKQHASEFIQSQELIYKDPKNAKDHFNASIDVCIKCHEVKCGGPIVRIKKLYIK